MAEAKTWGRLTNFDGKATGVAHMEKGLTVGKSLFLPFAFEQLVDNPPFYTKQALLGRALCQMQMTAASDHPPCAYFHPSPLQAPIALRGHRDGSTANLSWNDNQKLECTDFRPITGRYVVRGALGNPDPASFVQRAKVLPPPASYSGTEGVSAGSCYFYEVADAYVDDFDVPAAACP